MEVEAHVGLHPWERHPERPTRLLVNVEMFAPLPGRLAEQTRETLVDYDRVRDAVRAWPGRPHTDFLETLAAELVDLAFSFPRVEACRVSVMTPDVYNEAAGAGVEATVLRADYEAGR